MADKTYTVVKLPGKGEGFAIFDSNTNSTVPGSRSKFRRECYEAAAEMGITITETKKGK